MLIRQIKLKQFRNHEELIMQLNPSMNIIVGKNGVGKSNILESIILMSNAKSFRTNDESKLINKNSTYATVEIDTDERNLKLLINEKGKTFYDNNVLIKRISEVLGKLNAIIFKPGDIELFTQSPQARRREIDLELGKISPKYLQLIINYNRYLKQKNNLLKEKRVDMNLLSIIDDTLIPTIKSIVHERQEFVNEISKYIGEIYNSISTSKADIQVKYKKCCDEEDVETNLQLVREKDLYFQHSTFGPHKDDYIFTINNESLNNYASQGQKRMIIISLKLAIVRYIKEKYNKDVIVLLDDVISELDIYNASKLLLMLPSNQIIMTTTHVDDLRANRQFNLIELKEKTNG